MCEHWFLHNLAAWASNGKQCFINACVAWLRGLACCGRSKGLQSSWYRELTNPPFCHSQAYHPQARAARPSQTKLARSAPKLWLGTLNSLRARVFVSDHPPDHLPCDEPTSCEHLCSPGSLALRGGGNYKAEELNIQMCTHQAYMHACIRTCKDAESEIRGAERKH